MVTVYGTELITVEKIVKAIKKFEKEHSDSYVACVLPDDTYSYITGVSRDEEGSLCMFAEDEYQGEYDVDMLLAELETYSMDARVYIEAFDYHFEVTMDGDSLFTYDEDTDEVYCVAYVVGECMEPHPVTDSYADRLRDKLMMEDRRRRLVETVALSILTALLLVGLCYNIYAAASRTGQSFAENLAWSVVCLILVAINCLTLYYSGDDK